MTVDEVCNSFATLIANNEKRHARAKEDLKSYQDALERGEEPTGRRAEWTRDTALSLISLLGDKCEAFDNQYKGDRATSTDCINALLSAVNLILSQFGKHLEQRENAIVIVDG